MNAGSTGPGLTAPEGFCFLTEQLRGSDVYTEAIQTSGVIVL